MKPEPPNEPCPNCHSKKFWLREAKKIWKSVSPAQWLCFGCHPPHPDIIYESYTVER